MSMVKRCDRCGETIADSDKSYKVYYNYSSALANRSGVFLVDLCGDCMEDLKEWLSSEKGGES